MCGRTFQLTRRSSPNRPRRRRQRPRPHRGKRVNPRERARTPSDGSHATLGDVMKGTTRSAVILVALVAMFLGAIAYGQSQSPASSAASGSGQLRQVAYLKASNPTDDANFGSGGTLTGNAGNSAAISGDGNTIAIGAPHESSSAKGINGNQNDHSLFASGAVYVFRRTGNTWAQQAYVKASNPGQDDNFGSTVALSSDGNTMAVA